MPRGIYDKIKCKSASKIKVKLAPHQVKTMEKFLESPYKGMLLYHKLGSGKTCTGIAIADKMLKNKMVKRVFVISPGSLRQNWISEYCHTCGMSEKYLKKYFIFITMNYNVGGRLPDFTDSLVIIDEVHNLINGFRNQSSTFTNIYNNIYDSNCRVLALSGTPVYHNLQEFTILACLLKPEEFDKNGDFAMEYFYLKKDGALVPKDEKAVMKKLRGIISYFPGNEDLMPDLTYMPPIIVPMSAEQEKRYIDIRRKEKLISLIPDDDKKIKIPAMKGIKILYKKNIPSRSISNANYSSEFGYDSDLPDLLTSKGGWIDKKNFQDGRLYEFSSKITALIVNLIAHNRQKHVLFTIFKERSGVTLIKTLLNMCGITAEIFSGDLTDAQRQSLLKRFNSNKNKYGNKIRILLITEAGAEGISILDTRHMHILESSPRINKIVQAVGRTARFKSHRRLPKSEQNVKVWRYWSVGSTPLSSISVYAPDGISYRNGQEFIKTIDEVLDEQSKLDLLRMNSFFEILQEHTVL